VAEGDGRVVYRNATANRFSEARHGEALVEAAVQDLIRSPLSTHTERVVDLYGPPRRKMVIKASPMAVGASGGGTLVIIEDASEQQRVHAVRRDFVANVSHELKTPVGAVGVLAEALQGEDDPEVVARLAGRLQAEALRLGHTIDDLLALSRIESGELFEPTEVDLDDVVDAAIDRNASPAERRNVTLIVQRCPGRVAIVGDERQLVSAVANLVNNAITYSDPGSRVTVGIAASPDAAVISVRDRGVGIPASDLERIFERFYRVDPARSRNTGGTGLGLSIVRHVALNHGGEVMVESTEGRGSTFTLHLPSRVLDADVAGEETQRSTFGSSRQPAAALQE
jgi:two-component system sensor histidine kinase SenX3